MTEYQRPLVYVSKCLGFAPCRWNGKMIFSEAIENLKPFVEFQTVCPELEIGLGVPRHPIRLLDQKKNYQLIQPASGKNLTKDMIKFSHDYLNSVPEVDGWILKSRSPSCGIKNVNIYNGSHDIKPKCKGKGFFGREVLNFFPATAIEEDERLTNFRIREHFFTKIFTTASFRKSALSISNLIQFHTQPKLLLMSYNQKVFRKMGKIVANHEKKTFEEVISAYRRLLEKILSNPSRSTSNINVLMQALGFFSKKLSSPEKAHFLDILQHYRLGKIPLSVPATLLKSWIIRFDESNLKNQVYFQPFPEELRTLSDSGKRRNNN